jgi:hypothetical protein
LRSAGGCEQQTGQQETGNELVRSHSLISGKSN